MSLERIHLRKLRVMTLHGSKGLGSPVVYVTSLVDGLLPRFPDGEDGPQEVDRKIEEQRRLFYVAITRTKSVPNEEKAGHLVLSSFRHFGYAEAFRLNNGNENALASRFLAELGPDRPQTVQS